MITFNIGVVFGSHAVGVSTRTLLSLEGEGANTINGDWLKHPCIAAYLINLQYIISVSKFFFEPDQNETIMSNVSEPSRVPSSGMT